MTQRILDLRIYFSDSPTPVDVPNVCHIGTEGGLLRIITDDGESQWWPLVHVFRIQQLACREALK